MPKYNSKLPGNKFLNSKFLKILTFMNASTSLLLSIQNWLYDVYVL